MHYHCAHHLMWQTFNLIRWCVFRPIYTQYNQLRRTFTYWRFQIIHYNSGEASIDRFGFAILHCSSVAPSVWFSFIFVFFFSSYTAINCFAEKPIQNGNYFLFVSFGIISLQMEKFQFFLLKKNLHFQITTNFQQWTIFNLFSIRIKLLINRPAYIYIYI